VTKADIINIIAEGTGLTKVETSAVVDGFIASLSYALKKGETVELRGFGSFKLMERKARRGRNPKTGEDITIPARKMPVFKCSRDFRNYINESSDEENDLNINTM